MWQEIQKFMARTGKIPSEERKWEAFCEIADNLTLNGSAVATQVDPNATFARKLVEWAKEILPMTVDNGGKCDLSITCHQEFHDKKWLNPSVDHCWEIQNILQLWEMAIKEGHNEVPLPDKGSIERKMLKEWKEAAGTRGMASADRKMASKEASKAYRDSNNLRKMGGILIAAFKSWENDNDLTIDQKALSRLTSLRNKNRGGAGRDTKKGKCMY